MCEFNCVHSLYSTLLSPLQIPKYKNQNFQLSMNTSWPEGDMQAQVYFCKCRNTGLHKYRLSRHKIQHFRHLWNVGKFLRVYSDQHPKRVSPSQTFKQGLNAFKNVDPGIKNRSINCVKLSRKLLRLLTDSKNKSNFRKVVSKQTCADE